MNKFERKKSDSEEELVNQGEGYIDIPCNMSVNYLLPAEFQALRQNLEELNLDWEAKEDEDDLVEPVAVLTIH